MKKNGVPEPRAERLSRLVLLLRDLQNAGRDQVSSGELGRYLGTSSASIRKDLNEFSSGKTGAAYPVKILLDKLSEGLGLSRLGKVCLVGLDQLGLSLLQHFGTTGPGWEIVAGFDSRLNRLEQLELSIPLFPTTEVATVVARMGIETALLTVGAPEAQKIADRLVLGGIKGLLNFTPAVLRMSRKGVLIRDLSVAGGLTMMSYLLHSHE